MAFCARQAAADDVGDLVSEVFATALVSASGLILVTKSKDAHPSPGGGGGGVVRPGHHGLTGTPAHGSGIVARFVGSGCMTTCVALG
jgi:hypothetical protein